MCCESGEQNLTSLASWLQQASKVLLKVRTELNGDRSTQLHDPSRSVIGHAPYARQRRDLIGCSETRTVCARLVLSTVEPQPHLFRIGVRELAFNLVHVL